MAQNTQVEGSFPSKRYTRADFTALRYRLNGLPLDAIASRLYSESDLEERGIQSSADLGGWIKDLLAILLERAKKQNPLVAVHLENAQKFNRWPAQVVNFLVAAGEQDYSLPRPQDTLTEWFKPVIVEALKAENIDTLGVLKHYIQARGERWFLAVPRIGEGKARKLEAWLRKNEASMGPLVISRPLPNSSVQMELARSSPLLPLERISRLASDLDGSQGRNRNQAFCLISARNDLAAIQAYMLRFSEREPTRRAYQKELERFLLWCIKLRGVALSSVLTEDCEAYKAFLAEVPPGWTAARIARTSSRWRPFASALQPQSQRYSVQAIRTFFEWLVRVRYLGGNPWITVADPVVDVKEVPIDIDKALPLKLWLRLTEVDGLLDRICKAHLPVNQAGGALNGRNSAVTGAQYRLARAAILLIGFTGLRREEAASASRLKLKPISGRPEGSPLWELAVLGKRKKWRTVFLPGRAVAALRAHWEDRGHDFEESAPLALLSPITAVGGVVRRKHVAGDGISLSGKGFTADGLYRLVKTTVGRMARDTSLPLTAEDRTLLAALAPHALRHTFATQAAREMPQDVLQRLLGHASLNTTSIYVRAQRDRSIDEYAKYMDLGSY